MNLPFYIARRLAFNEKKSFSRFIIRIAILAVALSISIMIIGSAITRGYQEVIQHKFYDCWGHIHITNFLADPSNLVSEEALCYDSSLVEKIRSIPGVDAVNSYTIQSAIMKTSKDIEGILFKGITHEDTKFSIQQYIIQGKKLEFSDSSYSTDVLISEATSEKLNLQIGNSVILYFLLKNEHTPRARKVNIVGIYKTGLEEYDKSFAVCDARLINHMNNADINEIHGYEVYIDEMHDKSLIEKDIFDHYTKPPLQTYLIEKRFANIFSWLSMMKMNEKIIIIIMLIIAVINMMTALLILVLERTQMVGMLKALGMRNGRIQSIFVYSSMYILGVGMLAGTILGIGICLIQDHFQFMHLDEKVYYIKSVPIYLDYMAVLSINIIAMIICTLLLIIPSFIVRTISPTKAINFR